MCITCFYATPLAATASGAVQQPRVLAAMAGFEANPMAGFALTTQGQGSGTAKRSRLTLTSVITQNRPSMIT